MIKKAGVLAFFGFVLVSILMFAGQKASAATAPPTMTSPTSSTTYGLIPMKYTLGQTPLTNSVRLVLTGSVTITITLNIGSPTTGPYDFTINPKNVISSGAPIVSTTNNVIPDGTYTATLSYQNLAGDPAASVSATNVTILAANVDIDGDGATDNVENAGPNSGDANDDGTPDSTQANVITYVNNISGNYAVLESSCNEITGFSVAAESTSQPDTGYDYPFGLATFETTCTSFGDTATIRQYYYGVEGSEAYSVRKQLPNGTYTTIPGYHPLGAPIDGDIIFLVQYELTDGGQFDDDGTANGVIVDPSGAAVVAAASSSGGVNPAVATLADTGDNRSGITIFALSFIALGIAAIVGRSFAFTRQN